MANWQLKIDISAEHKAHDDETLTDEAIGPAVAAKLKDFRPNVKKAKFANRPYYDDRTIIEAYDEITQEFLEADDIELYDQALGDLYDWGDFELDDDAVWGKKVAWIDTFGLATQPNLPTS